MTQLPSNHLNDLGIDVAAILEVLALSDDPYCVFLSGSVIEGYGNIESDVDVYVIYPKQLPAIRVDFDAKTNLISQEFIENRRVDIESWTLEQVLQVARNIQQCPVGLDHWVECLAITKNELELAHRVRIGIPILYPENFNQLRQSFDFRHLSHIIRTCCVYLYGGVLEDAAGSIASKQHGATLFSARRTLQYAVDAFLAAHGETNTSDKWRFYKLEKLQDRNLIDQYWALEMPNIEHRDDIFQWAKTCLTFANNMALQAQKVDF